MEKIVYNHPDWEQAIYWPFNPKDGWEAYHHGLDEISDYAKNAEPFILVMHPEGDVPKGNPLNHMRRIIQFSKTNAKVLQTIIIMEADWVFAKTFARVINKIMALEPEVKLVFSVEEAHDVHMATLATEENTNPH